MKQTLKEIGATLLVAYGSGLFTFVTISLMLK